jgi:hypothetical protein
MTKLIGGLEGGLAIVATLGMLMGPSASAQTAAAPNPAQAADASASDDVICVSIARRLGTITVGRGDRRIDIMLMGGACEPPGSRISALWARYPADDSRLDVVSSDNCPAYREKIDELWAARPHDVPPRSTAIPVQAGPFAIVDSNDLFELRSSDGRREAAQWVRRTLEAVRPCWNTIRSDQTRDVVDDLYERLGIRP